MQLLRSILILFSFLAASCQHQIPATVSQQQDDSTNHLIPRQIVFGNPERIQARISPDGNWISWLAPEQGVMNIWLAAADSTGKSQAITHNKGHGIPRHMWSADSSHILYLKDKEGDENHHVYAVDIATNSVRDLTPVKEGGQSGHSGNQSK